MNTLEPKIYIPIGTHPREVFQHLAQMEANRDWANNKQPVVRQFNRREYLIKMGELLRTSMTRS